MLMTHLDWLRVLPLLIVVFSSVFLLNAVYQPQSTQDWNLTHRIFRFSYEIRVKEIPRGTRAVHVYLPLPRETQQRILDLQVEADGIVEVNRARKSGDRILHMVHYYPRKKTLNLSHHVTIERRERARPPHLFRNLSTPEMIDRELFYDYLVSNPYLQITDEVQRIAERETKGHTTIVEKAKALYEWTSTQMVYDKSGQGWGLGDVQYCLAVGKGNCTDYHSLFIALCRAVGIPARWDIGFPISYDDKRGLDGMEVGGYHCWAEFYVPGDGWIPVDISEGDKYPGLHDYFFGNLSANRILYTRGRNIELIPQSPSSRLNYFIYPHVVIDDQVHDAVEQHFSYKELQIR